MVQKVADFTEQLVAIRRESEERQAKRVADAAGLPYIDLRHTAVTINALQLVPEATAKDADAATVELNVHEVALAALDPKNPKVAAIMKDLEAQNYTVKVFIASRSGLTQAWYYYKFAA